MLVEGVDYYVDEKSGLIVLTSHYLLNRGYCCKHLCKHCPYQNRKPEKPKKPNPN